MAAPTTAPAPAAAAPIRPRLVFVDGTFGELVQELADYLQISEPVAALVAKNKNEEALAAVVEASSALNAAPEKDFTGTYNLLIHLAINESKDPSPYLRTICQNLSKPVTSSPVNGVGLALNALQAVFNLLAPNNALRYNVFMAILRFIRTHGLYDNLKPTLQQLPSWLADWDVSEEAARKLYLEVVAFAADQGEAEESYQHLLKALRTFDASDDSEVKSEEAEQLSVRAVRTALLSNTQYDFQDLRVLPTVQALADSEKSAIYAQLLDIFAEQDLEDYNDFNEEHEGWIEAQELDGEKLQRKMRLLTFTSLAASTQSRQIEYNRISKALQVPVEDVEVWAIDVIRAGLVEGKLSQQQQVFLVHRTTYRVFGEKQWRELGTRIDQWRNSLSSVLSVLRRQQAEAEAAKEREAQELERKLANAGLEGSSGHQGGNRNRGGARQGQRQQRPRNDNDD
ncbi:hypothetical protein SEUCBS139899_004133 [Sporothrix eucalyptigena]|uniref:Eukaryotic translation initiation factor 3 subunit M n=1 Tax=Sporothrix eucalyptigena TaxID=1812306 RepID=A0ABP0BSE2_9PEZI